MPSFNLMLALTVRPEMGQWTPAQLDAVQIVLIALWLCGIRIAAASGEELDRLLGAATLLCFQLSRITVKEAAPIMGMDESHLRQALRGEAAHHLSLNRLVRLPFAFWLHFGPALIYLVAKENVQAIAEDLKLRKSA